MDQENNLDMNIDEKIFDLSEVVTEGKDTYVPLKFQYPNTDKIVGVYVRPILANELTEAARKKGGILNNLLSDALYDNNKKLIPKEIVEQLPAGVTVELYKKIAEISGIPTDDVDNDALMEKYMGF